MYHGTVVSGWARAQNGARELADLKLRARRQGNRP